MIATTAPASASAAAAAETLLTWLFVSSQRGQVDGAANRDLPAASASGSGGLLLCPHAIVLLLLLYSEAGFRS